MRNLKRIIILAAFLLVIGFIGMAATYSSYKEAATYEDTEIIPLQDGELNEIEIDAENTEIHLLPANGSEPRAEYVVKGKNTEEKQLNTSIDGEKLSFHIEENSFSFVDFDFLYHSKSTLYVFLPEDMMQKIDAKTTNAKIAAENIQADELKFHTSNGKIEVKGLEASSVDLQSSNGKITLGDVQGDINIKTSNGGVTLQNIIGEVTANTNNAKITLDSIQGNTNTQTTNGKITLQNISGEIKAKTKNAAMMIATQGFDYPMDLETSNGKINITSDQKPENATLDLRTTNGSIRVFGSKDWDITYGNGETLIKAHTSNGGIRIE
ncbi:DUF4097 family beta strand repeat-containing protein [Oceanobacillus sp. J11TS1]|uniref:DUF4097 family beta strand repeat-containing protein n=1 Tax=Oceanobacillus sp. J11TS1 TaxID=2807191 RepID=UPI001B1CEA19|nr:DUF4097 family beta strand repeat-containing protein [Oceanobacillus sp. J11TS1]GIO25280.1 hypothetical protein J11TS1_38610 [Oceanobacillus sp. J11TS1]